ncbi:hypothetical protein KPH14_011364 [Odynerus spinipes]|uniref:CCHC-type domain-containing protein n=1 Tax=Odynerus spinipes TaxID=1348599 RepID=A0AAD9RJD5_9HYME|nr:hypothetical protein KPH14_011364 [Odynerus spinipes]
MKQQLAENQTTTTTTNVKTAKELLSEKQELSTENTNSWASFDDNKLNNKGAHNTIHKTKNIDKHKVTKKTEAQSEQEKDMKNDKEDTYTNNKNQSQIQAENDETNSQKFHQVLSKRQKRNMRKQNKNLSDSNTTNVAVNKDNDTTSSNWKHSDTNFPQKFNNTFINRGDNFNSKFNNYNSKMFKPNNKRKAPKIRDDKEHKRRKPDLGPMKIMLNGVEVEIVKYDGFPVKKEDAERLKELRQKMVMQGIPKSEIDSAMKLERRKAEKELARAKKHVCFHCRKSGHNLSDCPELASEQSGTGICFKCGSTEHTHFECKVTRAPEYRYATCFICREQGHISKQCPDNPRGVYPDGGACKICGDVTHLKKDCPDLIKEKEESTITVDKITDTTLESLDAGAKESGSSKDSKNTKNKIVKF